MGYVGVDSAGVDGGAERALVRQLQRHLSMEIGVLLQEQRAGVDDEGVLGEAGCSTDALVGLAHHPLSLRVGDLLRKHRAGIDGEVVAVVHGCWIVDEETEGWQDVEGEGLEADGRTQPQARIKKDRPRSLTRGSVKSDRHKLC